MRVSCISVVCNKALALGNGWDYSISVFNGSEALAVTGRDKDATWCSLGVHCRKLGWSKARALYELQQGLPCRTVPPLPPGYSIDWHNPAHNLNVETSDLTLILGVFDGPGPDLGFDTLTVSIEVLPPPDAPSLPAAAVVVASSRKVSEAELRNCILALEGERPNDPPDEEELWTEVERRLDATVSRDRIRQARDEIAPEWKLPPGRPRKNAQ
jgi:hypothetical protein